jgi:hypothetical protein
MLLIPALYFSQAVIQLEPFVAVASLCTTVCIVMIPLIVLKKNFADEIIKEKVRETPSIQ